MILSSNGVSTSFIAIEQSDSALGQYLRPITFTSHSRRPGSTSQVLVEIMSFYNRVGQVSWLRAERIFDKFYELLRDARDSVKETVLITVGRAGRSGIDLTILIICSPLSRVTTTNVLGVVISCLISRLADPNPALKGIAYMQVGANQSIYHGAAC